MSTTSDGFASVSERLPGGLTAGHALFAVVTLVWAALYLVGLGDLSLRVWDESRYATPARFMAEGGGWLDPMIRVPTHETALGESLRLNKPPLGYWLQATAMTVFGVTEFAVRLPAALATLGCAAVVYRIGVRTDGRRAGFAGALLFLAFPGMLLGSHGGRTASLDPLLALFGSLFVWLTWRGREDPRLLVPAGVAAGLAVLVKGMAAGVFVIVLLPVGAIYIQSYLTRWTAGAVASTVVVALPWHLYAYLEHGDTFLDEYFFTSVAARVQGEATEPPAEPLVPFLNYPWIREAIGVFVPPYQYALPFFGTAAVLALAFAYWRLRDDGTPDRATLRLLVWWLLAVPLTFVLGGGNHAWYLLPMYLPGAVLLGQFVAGVAAGRFGRRLDAALAGSGVGRPARFLARIRDRIPSAGAVRTGVAERWGGTAGAALYPVLCLVLVVALLPTYAGPLHEPYNDEQREIGTAIAAEVPEDETVFVWLGPDGDTESIMSVAWYADRPLERATPAELEGDASIRYAIVPYGNASAVDRPARVVVEGPMNNVTFVEFTDATTG